MLDILSIIPGKKRHAPSGWHSFNAVCCHHRGHKADTRGRAGVIYTDSVIWNYNCFNCNFKCGYYPGKTLTKNTRLLLEWSGLSQDEIERINLASLAEQSVDVPVKKEIEVNLKSVRLPEDAVPLDPNNPDHQIHLDYLQSRALKWDSYSFYVDPFSERRGIIIPYYYQGGIVGYTTRFYDNRKPKYISEQQAGYVFNLDRQQFNWNYLLLVEGQFDAISVDGCAYMGGNISDKQVVLISKLNKDTIVVPDRDKTGMEICDRALELGYKVSIPEWDSAVKDVNDAVKRYGKFPTILSILQSATNSKIKIEMKRKKYR